MTRDEAYMFRCLELARLGQGYVSPNPAVGAVLVYGDRIIGEGYHRQFGGPHAEVNCIGAVRPDDEQYIAQSTLYVSLEPCAHWGKTPPCADLIISRKIPRVVIGCRDPFKKVSGKGIERLREAGIEVLCGVLEQECQFLNRRFLTFHTRHRPYVILKWAQSGNARIGRLQGERLLISGDLTNRLVHKWRSEEMAILAGTNTVMADNPKLTNRLWSGRSPIRLIVDMHLRIPSSAHVYDGEHPTIIFNALRHDDTGPTRFYQVTEDVSIVHQVVNACYRENITSILVEGGAKMLQSFIDEGVWDEARVITNPDLYVEHGLPSPALSDCKQGHTETVGSDRHDYYYHNSCPYHE